MKKLMEEGFNWSEWDNTTRMEKLIEVNRNYMKVVAEDALDVEEIYQKYGIHVECGVCADGRISFAKYGRCFEGEIIPRRSIGAKFRYGHPTFRKSFDKSARYAKERGRIFVFFITFHYDDRGTEKCCAGWKNNTEKARKAAFSLRDQIRRAYPLGDVCPIVVGMETSKEEYIFFDETPDRFIATSEQIGKDRHKIFAEIQTILGSRVPLDVKKYVLRLIEGNTRHMTEHKLEAEHPISMEHCEMGIFFGEGATWTPPHRLMIINPNSMSLGEELLKAVELQIEVQQSGRVKNGFLLIVSTKYRELSEIPGAIEQTRDLTRFALQLIWSYRRDVHAMIDVMSIIVNVETKELTLVDMDHETFEFTPLEEIEYEPDFAE
ncbi:MAG: hypothetical protein UT64_C0024G0003 [Candidatus Falkowbacteria bacterium GW2011_GWF2_39_8]|uniref:Uncharacterized protein n=1 Tax=Candidatus Falkowbacteria bacterium GW2011_GWF2_39_8 TaxID=1618642 RepID=A0A0G0PX75_9BACT|nr:MAG: hypothetical protein UT64_C0024G0003 [Candidatus Falkowbacteria bacterium GW2011_GWF2_39_8]